MMIKSPCIRKFLKPLNMPVSFPGRAASAFPAAAAASSTSRAGTTPAPLPAAAAASSASRVATTASRPSARAAKNTMTTPNPAK